jgi:type I restriction enzyme, S subunit
LSSRCKPDLEDILYTKGGTTGIARVNTYNIDFNVWVHVAVLKTVNSVLPFFVQHALNSPFCYKQSQEYTHGVGNQDLGLTRMINIILAVCNKDEQEIVVQEIESRLSICDQLETTIEENLQRAESLRQSILKQAFTGKLVPQDPNDEPAAQLLTRIQQEQSAQQTLPIKPRKPGKKTP